MTYKMRGVAIALAAMAVLAGTDAGFAKHRRAAAHGGSWSGTWSGAWGGRDATSITVSGNHVVSYQYGGQTYPVHGSRVSASRIVYTDQGNTVTMSRTGANSAHATLHSSQGDGQADLTRQ